MKMQDGNDRTYRHATGLLFDTTYVASHDITIIMLYTEEDMYLVDYVCGNYTEFDVNAIGYRVDMWLNLRDLDEVRDLQREQKRFNEEYNIDRWDEELPLNNSSRYREP